MLGFNLLGSNFFFLAFTEADYFGKCIFLFLFCLSIISWSVILQKITNSYLLEKDCEEYRRVLVQNTNSSLIHPRELQALLSDTHPCYELHDSVHKQTEKILKKNQQFNEAKSTQFLSSEDLHLIEHSLYTQTKDLIAKLGQGLYILPTVISLAPFLGLLGTVWGILITFSKLHMQQNPGSNQLILDGLSLALVTTVIGLIVAIPALIAHNYIKHKTAMIQAHMDQASCNVLTTLEMKYRQTGSK